MKKKLIYLLEFVIIIIVLCLIFKKQEDVVRPKDYDKFKGDVMYVAITEDSRKVHKFKYYDKEYNFLYEELFRIKQGDISNIQVDDENIYSYGEPNGLFVTNRKTFSTDYLNTDNISMIKKYDKNVYYVNKEKSSGFCIIGDKCFLTDIKITDFHFNNNLLYLVGTKEWKTILVVLSQDQELRNEVIKDDTLSKYFIERNNKIYLISKNEILNVDNNEIIENKIGDIKPILFNNNGLKNFISGDKIYDIDDSLNMNEIKIDKSNYSYDAKENKYLEFKIKNNKVIINEHMISMKNNETIKYFAKLTS